MADQPPDRPAWRDAASSPSPSSRPVEEAWRTASGPTQKAPRWWWTRRARLALVFVALFLVTGSIVAVVRWLRPPRPMHLVLIGPGYENNLAVPVNSAGRRAADALARLAEEHQSWGGRRTAVELSGDVESIKRALQGSWVERAPKTVVIFISAHGLARADGSELVPCLVPADNDLRNPNALFRLPELLDVLAELPDTKKLLIVDAVSVDACWPLGTLHNDFAGALAAQAKRIEEIPNLVVLAGSARDQRSWVCPEWGQTYFAHFVLEGLKGAADDPKAGGNGNGRVDAWELYQYALAQVERYVRHNRDRLQTPILVGPEDRARDLELLAYQDYQPEQDDARQANTGAEVQKAWAECRKLEQTWPPPAVAAPHLWRRYLDILLRSEQLWRAGDTEAAAKWLEALDELRTRIVQAGPLPRESMQLSLAMPDALGAPLTPREHEALARIERIWQENTEKASYDDKDYEKARAALLDLAGTDRLRQQTLRAALAGLVVRKVASDAERRLTYGRRLLETVDAVAPYCRPAEAHYLMMLRPRLEASRPSPVDDLVKAKRWPLLQKALQVVLLGEQAAVGLGGEKSGEKLPAYSEQVQPWIADTIARADGRRREAQDLLFTSNPDKWQQADHLLDEARAGYESAQRISLDARRALEVRDRVTAALPYYTHWVAQAGSDQQVDQVIDLWNRLHQLRSRLGESAGGTARLAETGTLARGIAADFRTLEGWLRASAARDNATSTNQDRWHEIEAALAVPFLEPEVRRRLLRASSEISHDLFVRTEPAGLGRKDTGEENARQARKAAQRQGRLALAVVGLGADEWPDYPAVKNAIEAPEEGAWQHSFTRAGESVGRLLSRLPEETDALCEQAARADDLQVAAARLRTAVRNVPLLEGAAIQTRMKRDPAGELRRVRCHDLLCRQAHRAFLDWWAEIGSDDTRPAYFRRAAYLFLRDAEELAMNRPAGEEAAKRSPRLKWVDAEHKRVHDSPPLAVEWSPHRSPEDYRPGEGRLSLTDEGRVERFFRLLGPDATTVPGRPVAWVEASTGLRRAPGEGKKRLVELGHPFGSVITADPGSRPRAGLARHHVEGFFRGHRARVTTEVYLPVGPDLVVSLPPLRGMGRVAVQTKRSLYELYGAEHTAVALVLDCSGSMNTRREGDKRSRFEKALSALEAVLAELPDGVTVSLRGFGARGFSDDQNVDGIQRIWAPHRWRRDELGKRMREVRALEPAYGTPLIRSIALAAERDLPRDALARSIVAITDGGDSSFYSDWDLRGGRNISIEDFLRRKFVDSDIQISVVGFEVDQTKLTKEERRGYLEFRPAVAAIKGQYYDAEDNDQLTEFLTRSLLHMYYRVDPDEGFDTREVPDRGKNISQSDRRENWRWVPLRPDTYRIRIPSIRSLQQRIAVRPGDALLLDIVPGPGRRPEFRPAIYAETDALLHEHARVVPAKRQQGWLLAVLENLQVPAERGLHMMATLQKDPDTSRPPKYLQQIHPQWTWLEVPAAEPGSKALPRMRVTSLPDYPAPAWGVAVADWPEGAPSTLNAWWTEERLAPHGQLLKGKGQDFNDTLLELGPRSWRMLQPQLGPVTLEGVSLERCVVEDEPEHPREVEKCLVIRLSYPPDRGPFFVRLPNLPGQHDREHGQEDRFYLESGKYTGIFWPVTSEDAKKIERLELFSVAELKKASLHVDKLELGPPSPSWKRPAPLGRSKDEEP